MVTWSNPIKPEGLYGRFDHVTIRFISSYTSRNGILFVMFPFDTNLTFSRRQIRFSILGCLGDLDNTSLSKWLYEKKFTWFLNISHLLFVKHRNCVWKFESIDICNYFSVKKNEIKLFKRKYVYCLQRERSCDAVAIWSC